MLLSYLSGRTSLVIHSMDIADDNMEIRSVDNSPAVWF